MKSKIVKFLEFVMVIIALIVGAVVARNMRVESLLRGKEEPVSLSTAESGYYEDYVGLPAGDDIPRITTAQEWEDTWAVSCVTIEPKKIISPGIGTRNPWIGEYSYSRRGGTRRKPQVNTMTLDLLGDYSEYFLLQLPDDSYILAQMSSDDARSIKAGKKVTLPIGKKGGVYQQALDNIADLCREYDVYTEGIFYCVNDQWNAEHHIMVQLARLGIGFLVTIVLGAILITILDKIMKVKD